MSKYNALWKYVQKNGSQSFKLAFEEIQEITVIPIDHSFLPVSYTHLGSSHIVADTEKFVLLI